jgi:hypothetical protein
MDHYQDMVHALAVIPMKAQIYSREAHDALADIMRDAGVRSVGEVCGDTVSYLYAIHADYTVDIYKMRIYDNHNYVVMTNPSRDILYSVISESYARYCRKN